VGEDKAALVEQSVQPSENPFDLEEKRKRDAADDYFEKEREEQRKRVESEH
jgi:hypothetical protein